MNDRQLRYAIAVRDELSFTAAAKRLHVSQPSISGQVSMLEKELGFQLFRRAGRRIEITESGQAFLKRAQEVMDGFLGLTNLARRIRPGLTSSISMGISSSLINFLFPVIAEAFMSDLPHVQPSVISAAAPEIHSLVSHGDVDVGFTVEFREEIRHPIITWEKISKIDMALFTRPDHYLARSKNPVDLAELNGESLVMSDQSKGYGRFVRSMFTNRGLEPNIAATADNPTAIKSMIQSGMGIAILPALVAINEINLGQLVRIPIQPETTVSLCLLRQSHSHSEHTETCIRHIKKILLGYQWSSLHEDEQVI